MATNRLLSRQFRGCGVAHISIRLRRLKRMELELEGDREREKVEVKVLVGPTCAMLFVAAIDGGG